MRRSPDSKSMARALRQELSRKDIPLSHSECLEIVARQFGLDNWNILAAQEEMRSMDNDSEKIERLEQAVAILAAFISTMPGAPMSDATTAKDRLDDILRSVRSQDPDIQRAADKLYDLLRAGPRRHPLSGMAGGAANRE